MGQPDLVTRHSTRTPQRTLTRDCNVVEGHCNFIVQHTNIFYLQIQNYEFHKEYIQIKEGSPNKKKQFFDSKICLL